MSKFWIKHSCLTFFFTDNKESREEMYVQRKAEVAISNDMD
jgi:hypothetical protein